VPVRVRPVIGYDGRAAKKKVLELLLSGKDIYFTEGYAEVDYYTPKGKEAYPFKSNTSIQIALNKV